ncbi:pyruvate,water dikinase [Tumebacillus sp. BK434]|uniref:PEP-utilizing enzyme n=1 Tax=Tumebacillus sp. BK434 TaxID=2512169 RepID=UPI0010D6BF9F|nr:PEP-utilizing enzyme [Tumebacillus sp. BK434]TCP57900.1 pyruvate,water dikinase [Tumebacillus sp. BK434]
MKFVQEDLFLTEEDKQQGFWVQDDTHLADPFTPLFASYFIPAMNEGTRRAFAGMKFPVQQFRAKIENGYYYQWAIPFAGDPQAQAAEHLQWGMERIPKMLALFQGYVESELLPFYARLDAFRVQPFTRAEAAEMLQELYAFYQRAWELHFEIVMPRMVLLTALTQTYAELSGTANTAVVYDWLVGVMNKSLETDQGLWQLSRRARQSPALQELLLNTEPQQLLEALGRTEEGCAFLADVQDFLAEYGFRATNSHEFVEAIWVENPTPALTAIRRFLESGYDFQAELQKTVERRQQAFDSAMHELPEGEQKQHFLSLYRHALESWGLDEDHHFYIDAMLPAKSRLFLLAIGDRLVEAGVVAAAQDVFFFYLDELLDVLHEPSAQQELIARRRAEWKASQSRKPVPAYGVPPEHGLNPALEEVMGPSAPQVEAAQIKGAAASQGVYTGQVRVVHSPGDFSSVQPGDVLVCKTTTPAWTALFSVVGAIITDAGGILSHAGTVAREYQLPAVLGTKVATSLFRDGQTVTVDGTQGVVRFHE